MTPPSQSWRQDLVPRLLAQRDGQVANGRRLVVFVWIGDCHYEPALPRDVTVAVAAAAARKAALPQQRPHAAAAEDDDVFRDYDSSGDGFFNSPAHPARAEDDTWPSLAAMLEAALLQRRWVPGDGACAYWSMLTAVANPAVTTAGRPFFAMHPAPLERLTAADRGAVTAMLDLRRRCVDWLLLPAQRHICMLEPDVCVHFGQYAAERLRACNRALLVTLRLDAGLSPTEYISDVKAEFMLDTCASLQRAPLAVIGAAAARAN